MKIKPSGQDLRQGRVNPLTRPDPTRDFGLQTKTRPDPPWRVGLQIKTRPDPPWRVALPDPTRPDPQKRVNVSKRSGLTRPGPVGGPGSSAHRLYLGLLLCESIVLPADGPVQLHRHNRACHQG